jgi:nicotinamidase-related amidase
MTTNAFGSADLALPDDLRAPLQAHLKKLREAYLKRGWAGRVGFGKRPAVIVIDLAAYWLDPAKQIGSNLDSVVNATCQVLKAARAANVPVFFTSFAYDPAHPASPHDQKLKMAFPRDPTGFFQLDPRLEHRPTEMVIRKRYASAFKGTNLHDQLTLIVTGISTSHCVYATCRDATDTFRVIVPREAVGERCELMHEVFLLDIDIDLADVMPLSEVVPALSPMR